MHSGQNSKPRRLTQVGIVGAGPAGLVLAHLLHAAAIDVVVLEARTQEYVESRVRAGVLEQGTIDLLHQLELGKRMRQIGLEHHGIELGFAGGRHRIDLKALTGKGVMVYGQHEVVKDLIQAATERGIPIVFEAGNVQLHHIATSTPSLTYEDEGQLQELACDFIAGCDGFHGVTRPAIPDGVLTRYERVYPFSWLGILAQAAPSQEELIYMNAPGGFALFSMRSPTITRLYLQCAQNEVLAQWPDERIWDELDERLSCVDGWKPNRGPILQKGVTPMRSVVTEPMQFGSLFLAGDAVHIVPPTGAKGMNLAISDVKILADCFCEFYRTKQAKALALYSTTCLRRIWRTQRFSWWMTTLLHKFPGATPFDERRQIAELDYVVSSSAASTTLAENYVGLPIETIHGST